MKPLRITGARWRDAGRLAGMIVVIIVQLFLIAAMADRRIADFVYQGF